MAMTPQSGKAHNVGKGQNVQGMRIDLTTPVSQAIIDSYV
jgi:hypothetical protein